MRALLLCFVLLALSTAGDALAQAVVVGPDARPLPLELRRHHVEADVDEGVAVVTVEHVFHNATRSTVEGTFLFPLPAEAQVSRFSMTVDGQELVGELLAADEARRIYEDIVRRSLDPALLEMADYRTFRARIFPIPPGEERTITLRYDATLPREGNTVAFKYPLQGQLSHRPTGMPPQPPIRRGEDAPQRRDDLPAAESLIEINLQSQTEIGTVYSPSHEIDVDRDGARRATVTHESDGLDGRDFVLYYSLDDADVGATLLTHRPYRDRPGYFMLLLSPGIEAEREQVQPKDVVFVLDTSGSMAGDKIEQAKDALRYALNRLGARDRFGLVAFSSDVDVFRDDLATTAARDDALYFVDQIEARGGTNINDALLTAAEMLEEAENPVVIFLTDGLPSSGVTDEGQIRRNVADAIDGEVRIFPFGVGYDVNTRLLDGLARQADAFADYISPEENIEERVSTFYEKVRYPVMTGIEFEMDGADAYAFAPGTLPDLYRGGQLVLAGRYRRPGDGTLVLRGRLGDDEIVRRYPFRFPEVERERDFVARLWATRRVGQLLDEIRLHGENDELKDEVVALAEEFGLVTPYTSYLVQEEEQMAFDAVPPPPRPGGFINQTSGIRPDRDARLRLDAAVEEAEVQVMAQSAAPSGAAAVQTSKALRQMQEAEVVAAPSEATGLVVVEGRTLRQTADGAWVDAAFDAETDEAVEVRFASDAYFMLLRLHPEAAPFARLGDRVTFRLGERWVQVGPEGQEQMTEAELRRLFG